MASKGAFAFGRQLKELRIHLCQTSRTSQGVRDFISNGYVPLKIANPKFPILIRECSGVQPRLYARYEQGVEVSKALSDLNSTQVMEAIKTLSQKTV
ncbi:NADH dehydrogenase [ubiquinone] 1 alpha subcomplex subunit 2-like [Mizuhopecten yessoensis]|uniref:NADH dehydrogenase [ubiquinone] 1 alpha subcomplex subunit 2 n=1 Tax=Mizuhopecten yessoensis TaxID=6573 RepID=A0A210PPQ6_MIZYE|nr:NADH dehydrogenase [ubiquinone] 1 alpha subcomplex subunit 2-like [Mizuhopecten yessoensis]OWF38471.1 NADH dehydrogenase [ubiquinone] 1 alpha subcomplex subunit 2 [Mizuhopecten yessoensis]